MKRISIFSISALLLLGGVTGCFDDKGNYSYGDINEMEFTIAATAHDGRNMPIDENGESRYKQSSTDTLKVSYVPEVKQTLAKDESNLEFMWRITDKDGRQDSLLDKKLVLAFPPLQPTHYDVVFSVTDLTTHVSQYKKLRMSTVKPYMNSWLVLNASDKAMVVSAVEEPDSANYIFTRDAYADLGNAPRFQQAAGLIYSPVYFDIRQTTETECLQIYEPDSLILMNPFDMKIVGKNEEMLPSVMSGRKIRFGISAGVKSMNTYIVDDASRLYTSGGRYGNADLRYREVNSDAVGNNYRVTGKNLITNSNGGYLVFWDQEKAQFLYVDGESIGVFATGNDWPDKEVVWVGKANKSKEEKAAMGMALVKDLNTQKYWLHHFTADGFKVTGEEIGKLPLDKESCFASSGMAFTDQFFYTVGSKLYRFVVASRESVEIYDAGMPITRLKFRVDEEHELGVEKDGIFRYLALVVDGGEKSEIHELFLNTAGDLDSSKVYTGFGHISDLCFTFVNRTDL